MKKLYAISILVLLLFLAAISIGIVAANPLPASLVSVQSPRNNQVYPSDSIQLIFTPTAENCTSFSYVLDDRSPVTTDGHTTITNLSWGSHELTIYANRTLAAMGFVQEDKNMVASVVYFSVVYSPALVAVVAITLPAAIIVSLSLFFRHRQIAVRLKGKKSGVFWFGTLLFVPGFLIFIVFSLMVANDYLFPYWPKGLIIYLFPYWLTAIVCIIFTCIGFGLMWWGTQQSQEANKKPLE